MIFRNLLSCLVITLLLSSCITKSLWGDKSYEERIDKFFAGSDGRYVVLIGTDYHYVFTDNSGVLKIILSLGQKGILTLNREKTHLKLDSNNDVKGFFVIEGPFSILPPEDIAALWSVGLKPNTKDELSIRIKLEGRRYSAKYLGDNFQNSSNINTSYKIPIYYSDSSLVKGVGKAAVTPIAVTLDAVLLIGKIVIYPFSL